jgi:hypothetical protein
MPPLSSDDAFALSKSFRDLSVAIGDIRMAQWASLTPETRRALEDEEWSLLNASSEMVTKAVGLVLDESAASAKKIQAATGEARAAVKRLHDVAKVIDVATAAVGLAAAIVSKDPGAIAKNVKNVFDAATA